MNKFNKFVATVLEADQSLDPQTAAKKVKQYQWCQKIVQPGSNASPGEKQNCQAKMSEFEKKYNDIISKYKTPPQQAPATQAGQTPPPSNANNQQAAPSSNVALPQNSPDPNTPTLPAPASKAALPAPATQQPEPQPTQEQPPAPQPTPVAPTTPSPTPTIPVATPVRPPATQTINPPPFKPKQQAKPQQNRAQQPRPYTLGGLQQQWKQMGLGPNATAAALPQAQGKPTTAAPTTPAAAQNTKPQQNFGAYIQQKQPGVLTKIAQAPFKALQKGVGAYSKITNAPRALGQSLKAAAQGQPQQLQQQIGSVAGIPADNRKQQEINSLLQRLRTNPNDNQAMSRLKALKAI